MQNARTGELRTFFVLRVGARPAGGGVPVRCVTANPDKEKQKEKQKQKRDHDTDHDELPDEATFDEDSMPGEAKRPPPPSEKPEACQNRAVSQKAPAFGKMHKAMIYVAINVCRYCENAIF